MSFSHRRRSVLEFMRGRNGRISRKLCRSVYIRTTYAKIKIDVWSAVYMVRFAFNLGTVSAPLTSRLTKFFRVDLS